MNKPTLVTAIAGIATVAALSLAGPAAAAVRDSDPGTDSSTSQSDTQADTQARPDRLSAADYTYIRSGTYGIAPPPGSTIESGVPDLPSSTTDDAPDPDLASVLSAIRTGSDGVAP